ncbi:MAG: hypothetical protein V2A77_00590, partial [Pseudomonadota bacterium]
DRADSFPLDDGSSQRIVEEQSRVSPESGTGDEVVNRQSEYLEPDGQDSFQVGLIICELPDNLRLAPKLCGDVSGRQEVFPDSFDRHEAVTNLDQYVHAGTAAYLAALATIQERRALL